MGYRAKCPLRRGEDTATDILLNCAETKRWREQFLSRKWLDKEDDKIFKKCVECTKITTARIV